MYSHVWYGGKGAEGPRPATALVHRFHGTDHLCRIHVSCHGLYPDCQGNRIWNVLDISAACCGVKENRFYPHGVEARGWGMGWRHLRRVLKVLKIHGLVTPGGTICLKF